MLTLYESMSMVLFRNTHLFQVLHKVFICLLFSFSYLVTTLVVENINFWIMNVIQYSLS